jgi:dTDP-4-amino-4,6-dideoxygalactose transaminase
MNGKIAINKIYVTKTFMPPVEEYEEYLHSIWQSGQLTNQGPLLRAFEDSVAEKLSIEREKFHFVSNGTIALQVALKALNIEGGEIITTPFSYIATTSSIMWERCKPVYADIDPQSLCIDPSKIEKLITKDTIAIMAVHVFGNPCDVEAIESIAIKYGLKVIYDGAHAFGVKYKGKSLLEYGDASTCSFHATKLFHTIEGGAVIAKDKNVSDKLEFIKRFGHYGEEHYMLGINAKASEFQAAMGLCNLKYVDEIISKRRSVFGWYDEYLKNNISRPFVYSEEDHNYSYYPVVFKDKEEAMGVVAALNAQEIYPRRYFYPSINTIEYVDGNSCPVSEDIASRILCLPLYSDLEQSDVKRISEIINQVL